MDTEWDTEWLYTTSIDSKRSYSSVSGTQDLLGLMTALAGGLLLGAGTWIHL